MSEELEDASLNLPRAMLLAIVINGILGIVTLITFCFCMGNVEDVVNSASAIPLIDVLYSVTGSLSGTVVLTTLLIVLTYFAIISCVAAASRQAWAFARDNGFPFSRWLSYVSGRPIPIPLH